MAAGLRQNIIKAAIVNQYYVGDVFLYDVSCASSMLQAKRPKNEKKFGLGQKNLAACVRRRLYRLQRQERRVTSG
jgi:hypothetical protein